MKLLSRIKVAFGFIFSHRCSIETSIAKEILETEVDPSVAALIKNLGVEGIFEPLIISSPEASFMIIDLDLLREIRCDINYDDLSLILASHVTTAQLNAVSYIFLKWEE